MTQFVLLAKAVKSGNDGQGSGRELELEDQFGGSVTVQMRGAVEAEMGVWYYMEVCMSMSDRHVMRMDVIQKKSTGYRDANTADLDKLKKLFRLKVLYDNQSRPRSLDCAKHPDEILMDLRRQYGSREGEDGGGVHMVDSVVREMCRRNKEYNEHVVRISISKGILQGHIVSMDESSILFV